MWIGFSNTRHNEISDLLLTPIQASDRRSQFDQKEQDLKSADDGKSSQQSHGSSNYAELIIFDFLVSFNVVVGGRVKVDLHQLEGGLGQFLSWND